jgi:choline dehydrogenase-like flavoprotein
MKDKAAQRILPEFEKVDLETIQGRRAAIEEYIIGEYHSCGTCALGDTVDSRLRVKGVQGLRVADASVFPNNVSGNIVSSVYMVAEKAADLIKEDNDYAALGKASS